MSVQKLFTRSLIAASLFGLLGGAAFAAEKAAPAAQKQANPMMQLKSALKISSAQEGAWNNFVAAYSNRFVPSRNPSPQEFNSWKTPQRVDFLKSLRGEETAFINKRYDASVALYGQLNDEQKKQFDMMTATPVASNQPTAPAKGKKHK